MTNSLIKNKKISLFQAVITLILISILISIIFFMHFGKQEKNSTETFVKEEVPDFFGKGIILRMYNKEGSLDNKITVKNIKHYKSTGETVLTFPYVIKFENNKQQNWQVKADKGELSANKKILNLSNHVVITCLSTNKTNTALLKTDKITINTNKKIIETDNPVSFLQGNTKVYSKGLEYDYKNNIVKLKSKVHSVSVYDHAKKKPE